MKKTQEVQVFAVVIQRVHFSEIILNDIGAH